MGCCRPGNTDAQPLFLPTPKSCFKVNNFPSLLCPRHLRSPSAPHRGSSRAACLFHPMKAWPTSQIAPVGLGSGLNVWVQDHHLAPTLQFLLLSRTCSPKSTAATHTHNHSRTTSQPRMASSATLVIILISAPSRPALFTTWTLPTQRLPGTVDPAPLS